MYCSTCGQEIENDSKFCKHCGYRVDSKEPEERFFDFVWEPTVKVPEYRERVPALAGLNRRDHAGGAYSEAEAREIYWYRYQYEIQEAVQPYLDSGWRPVTEFGPGAIQVELYDKRETAPGLGLLSRLMLVNFEWICSSAILRLKK